ncbi:hypothetical protein SprV_0902672100 [Sparganum proliferum]
MQSRGLMNGRHTVASNGFQETNPATPPDKMCTCNCTCRRRKNHRRPSRLTSSEAFSPAAEDIEGPLPKGFSVRPMGGQKYKNDTGVDQVNYQPLENNFTESAEQHEEDETRQRAENILTALSELSQLRFRGQELSRLIESLQESKINLQERLSSNFQKTADFHIAGAYRQQPVQFHQMDSIRTQRSEMSPTALPAPPKSPSAAPASGKQPTYSPRLQNAIGQQGGICPVTGSLKSESPAPGHVESPRLPTFGSVSIRERKASLSERRQNLISDAFIGRIRERIRERRQHQQKDQGLDVGMTAGRSLKQTLHASPRATDLVQDALIGAPQGDKGLPYHRRFSLVGNNPQTNQRDPSEQPRRWHSADPDTGVHGEEDEEEEAAADAKIALLTSLAQISLRSSPPPPPAPTLPRALLPVKPQSERLLSTASEHLADVKSGGDPTTDRCRHPATQDDQPAVYHKLPSVKWNCIVADAATSDRLGKAYRPIERRGESEGEEEEEAPAAVGVEEGEARLEDVEQEPCHVSYNGEEVTEQAAQTTRAVVEVDTAAERPSLQKRVLFSSQEEICAEPSYENADRSVSSSKATAQSTMKIKPAIKKFPRTEMHHNSAGGKTTFKGENAGKRCGAQRSVAWLATIEPTMRGHCLTPEPSKDSKCS